MAVADAKWTCEHPSVPPTDAVAVIVAMGGPDCEMIRGGWLAQPANAWSSVAYLAGATYVLARHRPVSAWFAPRLAIGAGALAAVGLGTFLYHGPQPAWGERTHDLAITALLLALIGLRSSRVWRVAHALFIAAVALVATALVPSPLVHGTLGALVVLQELREQRRAPRGPHAVVAAVAIVVAGVLFLVGRTGGPLCSPGSLAQPHAGWHFLTALAAAALLARADVPPLRSQRRQTGPVP